MSAEALLAVLTSAGLLCMFFGVKGMLATDASRIDTRLRHYSGHGEELTDLEKRQAASVQVTQMLASRLEESVSGRGFAAALRTDLARANVRLTVGEFLILHVTSATTVAAFAFLLSRAPAVTAIFAIVGWFIPRVWLGRRQAGRLKAFNNQLGDTIALMANSLRAGMSLVQTMEMISREGEPPISEEFQRVIREIGLGVGPQQALLHLTHRINSEDLELLVTAILVQFEIGGNLSRILDTISVTIRERVKLQGEIRTMSAQGRMSGYILSGMPAAIGGMLMLIAPSYMGALFKPGPWLALPVLALTGVIVGSLVIRRLVVIEA
jgi:tight adherence protein B